MERRGPPASQDDRWRLDRRPTADIRSRYATLIDPSDVSVQLSNVALMPVLSSVLSSKRRKLRQRQHPLAPVGSPSAKASFWRRYLSGFQPARAAKETPHGPS
jgi:hypothetical protein